MTSTGPTPPMPSAAKLLDAWDAGRGLSMPRRAAILMMVARPDLDAASLALMPLGERDALLLAWRARIFGDRMRGIAQCPGCGETVEIAFSNDDLCAESRLALCGNDQAAGDCNVGSWNLRYRVPNCRDAIAIADPGAATEVNAQTLILRCITDATRDGIPVPSDELARSLPDVAIGAVAQAIVQADPGADILAELRCAGCARQWSAPIDIVAFVWAEIAAWARRILNDVTVLARTFGWHETDILAMSPQRREDYLALVGA